MASSGFKSSIFAFLAIALSGLYCSSPESKDAVLPADKSLVLKVEGMVCASGCAKFIEKKISAIAGVSSCTVNFTDGIAEVNFASQGTSEEEIIREISELNDGQYKAEVISTDPLIFDRVEHEDGSSHRKSGADVSLKLPELVTYFISRLVR